MAEFTHQRRSIAAMALGLVIAVIGAVLTIGGGWLLIDSGSPYYVIAGITMVAAGTLLFLGRKLGVWVYVAVFSLTVPWALWEAGADPWALVPRLVGPAILLAAVALTSPLIDRHTPWRSAALGAAGTFVFLGIVLWGAAVAQPNRVMGDLPPVANAAGPQAVGADWPAWGGTNAGERFSTLAQITPANVGGARAGLDCAYQGPAERRWRRQICCRDHADQDR